MSFSVRTPTALLAGAALALFASVALPDAAQAQEPGDNIYTRSASLYLNRAFTTTNQEDKQRRFEEALQAARNSIEQEPGNAKGFLQAGTALFNLDQYEEADSMMTRAIELYPEYAGEVRQHRTQAWVRAYNRAIGKLRNNNFDEAIADLEMANEAYRQRPEAMMSLAQAYTQTGQPEDAFEQYRMALEVLRDKELKAQQSEQVQASWTEREGIASFNLAQLLAREQRYEEAVTAYEGYLERNPEDLTALSNLAVIKVQMGDPEGAQEIYQRLMDMEGVSPRDLFNAGIGLFQAGSRIEIPEDSAAAAEATERRNAQYSRAALAFSRAAEVAPDARDIVYNWAQTLFLTNQYEKLLPAAQQLVELDPYNENARRFLAQAHAQTGDIDTGQEVMDEAEAFDFYISSLRMQASQGGAVVTGQLENNTLPAGTEVTLRFHFIAQDGSEMGTAETTFEAPEPEMNDLFRVDFPADSPPLGYWYERVGGDDATDAGTMMDEGEGGEG